ncbi:cytochrome c family protein [Pseudoruegeria sp. SK021]|uniref:c-type cytochrome n=1 Tax=Pseudoruegeria sp. SK021 TaxID=1933035 RepID=UPI000A249FF2|nr:hypothetical protein BV911_02040 [Pseudoruegeria sp. SK021]
MLDTMTVTKVVAALCGSLLVFLLGGWVGQSLFTIGGGHGDHVQAYLIDTGDENGAETAEEEVDFAALVAAADVEGGARVFGKCAACHKVNGENATGPHLDGVVGRHIGSVGDFAYSDALADLSAETWTPEHLSDFLENPKGWAKGTKMSFAGLKKDSDRADVVAYLISESPDFVFDASAVDADDAADSAVVPEAEAAEEEANAIDEEAPKQATGETAEQAEDENLDGAAEEAPQQ